MIRLTINNSLSRIENCSQEQFIALRTLLSYTPDTGRYFVAGRRDARRYLIDKKGNFPSGLLSTVEAWFESSRVRPERADLRVKPLSNPGMFSLKLPFTPYPEQNEAARVCASKHRGCVSAVTGFGKSVTMALLIARLQVKTLIVVPNLSLKTQLKDFFRQS